MAETYQRQAELAARLIKSKGQPVTFYFEGGTEYDNLGNEITTTGETVAGHGLLLNYRAGEIDGSIIQSQDAYVLYSGAKPKNTMLYDHGGREWTVINSEPLQPTSAVILYKVQVR